MFYGPPGAGKGTQANLVAGKFGLLHFDTGKFIEQHVHDPENSRDKTTQEEKNNFDSGKLCTPSWVLKIVRGKTSHLSNAGFGLTFSGSPRTMFEAFGDKKNKGLMEVLEKDYGKKNIILFLLKVSPKTSIFRNSHRLMCSNCGTTILASKHKGKSCPICSGKLVRRTLDVPDVIKVRLKEYKKRTAPILAGLKKRGYKITAISGEALPHQVFSKIISKILK